MKELLTYAPQFDSLVVGCLVQFVIILTEFKKPLSGNEVFVQQDCRSEPYENYGCESLIFLLH
jgi:hypothetical protein